ncbi:MAG: class II aldolase/adducin family protein [Candidatus Aminicenantes bacterium]|nr:class II aldolase/adducin family protein [Candidatus Aminicenantes bacterium]
MDKTKEQIIKIGKAMLALGLQNTHSGNISIRMGEDMYITKTGSMKGHLQERDIVISGLKAPKFGLFQASSEIGTHQKILRYAQAAMHAHSLPATLLSYIVPEVKPIDFLGKKYLHSIPVVEFEYPVGSKEMEEEIPIVLETSSTMIVKAHGPFVRGASLHEAFLFLCILDYSSEILLNLKTLGVDLEKLPEFNYPEAKKYKAPENIKETQDKELISQFKRTSTDVFSLKLSPFHTGSLSVRDGNEMIYSPALSSPEDLENDILRVKIGQEDDDFFRTLHQAVYRYSSAKSAIFTHSPFAMIQSIKTTAEGLDRIVPIDAEGGYLYPAIPVLPPDTDFQSIIEKATRYKMVALAGLGVLAIGHTPGYTIHHCSSVKNICFLKTQLEIMNRVGLVDDISKYLDERGKTW